MLVVRAAMYFLCLAPSVAEKQAYFFVKKAARWSFTAARSVRTTRCARVSFLRMFSFFRCQDGRLRCCPAPQPLLQRAVCDVNVTVGGGPRIGRLPNADWTFEAVTTAGALVPVV